MADFISDETSETLEDNLIKLITPIRHSGKIIVRTDQATGFTKALKSSKLAELDISIELGNSLLSLFTYCSLFPCSTTFNI